MTTYAIVLTAILSFIAGYMACVLQEEIRELIENRRASKKTQGQETAPDQAVELVKENEGTEILTYDQKVN